MTSKNPYKQVGDRLQQLQRSQGLTQAEIGAIAHVSQQTVSRWINGQSAPDIVQASEIERMTGKDLRVF
jgi:transcriptional regulator with XRE-family HTH domain